MRTEWSEQQESLRAQIRDLAEECVAEGGFAPTDERQQLMDALRAELRGVDYEEMQRAV